MARRRAWAIALLAFAQVALGARLQVGCGGSGAPSVLGAAPAARHTKCSDEVSAVADRVLRELPHRLLGDLVPFVLDLAPFRYQVAWCRTGTSVTIWGSGSPRQLMHGKFSEVLGVEFFPLGERALSWSRDGAVVIWDTMSGFAVQMIRSHGPVECARVFPQGDRIVTCTDSGACSIWEVASGHRLSVLGNRQGFPSPSVDVFPEGNRVLIWSRSTWATVWDASGGRLICMLRRHTYVAHFAKIIPRGGRVVSGGFENHRAAIWDANSCEVLHDLAGSTWLMDVAVLGVGHSVATLDIEGAVGIWDVETGKSLRQLPAPTSTDWDVMHRLDAFPMDDRLVTLGRRSAVIWNTTSGVKLRHFATQGEVGVAVSRAGDLLVTCGSTWASVWDVATGARLHMLGEKWPHSTQSGGCIVAVGIGAALDPHGFGRGISWRELP